MLRRFFARWRAYRKERAALLKMVELLKDEDRQMQRVYVQLALAPLDLDARDYLDGTVLHCVYCHKTFVQDNRHCALGFCQECS